MDIRLARSYRHCERVARREAANFYPAFRLLPRRQRAATCALYAFLRVTDDLADGPDAPAARAQRLADWRELFDAALEGDYRRPLFPALHDTVRAFRIPRAYLEAVFLGAEMDLGSRRYQTFAELYLYCYRVASVVGLCCIHIWGHTGAAALEHAEAAGIAFQLTNILRDLGEDAARGRVYLPREDLERFGVEEGCLRTGEMGEAFRRLMAFQVQRARDYYAAARPLTAALPPAGRAVFAAMSRTYSALLDVIERAGFDVFTHRARLGPCRKLALSLGALPARFGQSGAAGA